MALTKLAGTWKYEDLFDPVDGTVLHVGVSVVEVG